MKKVKFKKFIPQKYEEGTSQRIEGTGKYEEDFIHDGIFHQWGIHYEEYEDGLGNETVAIVEIKDGTIMLVSPIHIKFI